MRASRWTPAPTTRKGNDSNTIQDSNLGLFRPFSPIFCRGIYYADGKMAYPSLRETVDTQAGTDSDGGAVVRFSGDSGSGTWSITGEDDSRAVNQECS